MTMFVTHDLQVARGTSLARDRAMPEIPDEKIWQSPMLDRVGEIVQRGWMPLGGIAVAGAVSGVLAARRSGRGLLRSGAWGVAAGAMAIAGALAVSDRLRPDINRETDAVRAGQKAQAPSLTVSSPNEKIKMVTFNVRGGMGQTGLGTSETDLDLIAAHIKKLDPDILVLQEMDRFAVRSGNGNTLNELSARLNPDSAVASYTGTLITGRQQGCAIMTFNDFRVANARGIIIDDPEGSGVVRRAKGFLTLVHEGIETVLKSGPEIPRVTGASNYSPREAIDSIVVTPEGNDIRVLSHHLGGLTAKQDYQKHQLPPYAAALDAWDGATLVGGDFNIRSAAAAGERERTMLGAGGLSDSFLDVGIPAGDEQRATVGNRGDLDRIYRSTHFKTNSVAVVQEEKPWVSDHKAVSGEFTIGSSI